MLPVKQQKAYEGFYDAARHNEILGERETLLLHLTTLASLRNWGRAAARSALCSRESWLLLPAR
jgi:hypothetical protein